LDESGELYGGVIVHRDVTEQRQAEAETANARRLALEAASLRNEFLSNISHELLTPLNAVLGMSQLLLDTTLAMRQREYAETIRSSGELLRDIVEDVLDFSHLSEGRFVLEENQFDPHDTLERAAGWFSGAAQKRGLRLTLVLDEGLPRRVIGDSHRLEQILTNLLSNAVKFTERGEIVMRACASTESAHDISLAFEVSDTGIGIDSDHQYKIFQPFSQVDGSASRKYGGSGLGLAICAELVRLMDGQISVKSALGQGSTFYFTAKMGLPAIATAAADANDGAGGDASQPLMVEDNLVNQKLTETQLMILGFGVDVANDGREALDAIARKDYPIVLMDWQMPKLDGYEATAEIRRRESGSGKHAIVIDDDCAYPDRSNGQ